MPSLSSFRAAIALYSFVAGCALAQAGFDQNPCNGVPRLICSLSSTLSATLEGSTSTVGGDVHFTPEVEPGCDEYPAICVARITGTVFNLGDTTPHGWHIHEFGDLSTPDGSAQGGHFNPTMVDHALPAPGGGNIRHVGDLGNLYPDASGVARLNFVLDIDLRLVNGRGVIVHAVEDNGGQPTGNAGARLAQCALNAT